MSKIRIFGKKSGQKYFSIWETRCFYLLINHLYTPLFFNFILYFLASLRPEKVENGHKSMLFAMQKTVYWLAKGGLLACKRPPFAKRDISGRKIKRGNPLKDNHLTKSPDFCDFQGKTWKRSRELKSGRVK